MHFVIARFQHETNTFSPIPTPLNAFYPAWGEEALTQQTGARTAMGAFIAAIQASGATLSTPVAAYANPSASVDASAYNVISDSICAEVEKGCDGILLDLHGAMVVKGIDDGEGSLLERIRKIAPHTPLGVALDLHANVTPKMIANCDVMLSFKTYPHIDMYETGEHVVRLILEMLKGNIRPHIAFRQLPILSHTLRSNTHEGSMRNTVDYAKTLELRPGILAASIIAGFSLADFADAGMSVIVVGDKSHPNGIKIAETAATQLARQIYNDASGFVYKSSPLQESLSYAKSLNKAPNQGPVLLLDHSDNVMSGGTCDTTDILEAALAAGMTSIIAGPFFDPLAVSGLLRYGLNQTCTIEFGNRFSIHQQSATRSPLRLSGTVKAIHDGNIVVSGPIFTGSILRMGPSVLFETEHAQVVISSERVEPYDIGVLTAFGVHIPEYSYVLLKSRMYCRPVFAPLCKAIVECDSDRGGPTSSNYEWFHFQSLRRPIYPLDPLPPFVNEPPCLPS